VNICSSLIAHAQSPETIKPSKSSLNDSNAIDRASHVDSSVQAAPRCLAGTARPDVPVNHTLDQRAAYLGVYARGPTNPLMNGNDSTSGTSRRESCTCAAAIWAIEAAHVDPPADGVCSRVCHGRLGLAQYARRVPVPAR
jgi:hypothetical protein